MVLSLLSIGRLNNRETIVRVKHIYTETLQPPEMNQTLFRLGVKFVGAKLGVLLLEAEFARGRVCKGSSLAGPTIAQLEGSFSSESASDYLGVMSPFIILCFIVLC